MSLKTYAQIPPPLRPASDEWPWNSNEVRQTTGNIDVALPRITIVTPSFNQGPFLEETIRSVLLQGYPNLEYMVIDGASGDETLEIIEHYADYLDYWVSEKDAGQVDAINKGLRRATGQWFNWINSDDTLADGALSLLATHMELSEAVLGGVRLFGTDIDEAHALRLPERVSVENLLVQCCIPRSCVWSQPGVWLQTDRIKSVGGIDQKLHFCFDWDLLIRYFQQEPKVEYTREIVAKYRFHSYSKSCCHADDFLQEHAAVLEKSLIDADLRAHAHRIRDMIERVHWREDLQTRLSTADARRKSGFLQILVTAMAKPSIRLRKESRKTLKRHWRTRMGTSDMTEAFNG